MIKEGFVLVSVLGIFVFGVSKWRHGFWRRMNVPQVEVVPLLGSILCTFRMPRHELEISRYNRLGKLYGYYEGNTALLTVANPDLIKIIMKNAKIFPERRRFTTGDKVIDNMPALLYGDDWKRVRCILKTPFSTSKIQLIFPIFADCAKVLLRNFATSSEGGQSVDLKKMFGEYTMDVISSAAFSIEIDSHNNPNHEFVKHAMMIFDQVLGAKMYLFMTAPWLVKLFRIKLNPQVATTFFAETARRIIAERRNSGMRKNDFLQILLDASLEYKEKNKGLSEDELVSLCTVFFLAGYDTTATTLSFATYLLAQNQDVQDRLRQEVDEALNANDGFQLISLQRNSNYLEYQTDFHHRSSSYPVIQGELTYEAVKNMSYLDNVISETVRLYPPVFKLERQASETFKLGDTGISIPKGMIVNIPTCALHRDASFFPDPEVFNPDRFTAEEKARRHEYCYLPFGHGPRACAGKLFALLEIKTCLAYIIASFVIRRCHQTEENVKFDLGQHGMLQAKNILVRLQERSESPLRLNNDQ